MSQIPYVNGPSLADRTVSGFPLSIGTGLAFESLFNPSQAVYDPERKPPEHIEISKYQEMYINAGLLIRNIISASSKEALGNISINELKNTVYSEMDVINSLLSNEGNNLCKPIYYFCTYDKLTKQNKEVKFRIANTPAQKLHDHYTIETIKSMLNESEAIHKYDSEIKPAHRTSAIIFTHIPYDLVSYKNFNTLHLLESHTGKLKPRNQWNTKYYSVGDRDLSILPFYEKLLFVFGDKVLIHPGEYKLRTLVLEIAKNRTWTPMTTMEKIMFDLELDVKEPYVLEYLRKL